MEDLIEQVETERKLRDIWNWLPDEISEFTTETWEAMIVTVAERDAPYRPVDRFESLLEETNELRLVRPEIALMEPCFEVLVQLIDDGVDVVLVARPESHTYFLSTYPERSVNMMQQDNFTVLEHDDLPSCGTGLLDERVVISCYEQDSGTVHVLIDTDVAAVREWAQSVFETHTSEAQPVEPP
jgi:histidinol phosphatase-like PHP family hydrolase